MVPAKTVCTKFGTNNVVLTMVEYLTISVPCLANGTSHQVCYPNEYKKSGMFMNFGTKI